MGWQDAPVVEEESAAPPSMDGAADGGGGGGQPAWMSAPPVDGGEQTPDDMASAAPPKTDWEAAKESLGQMLEPQKGTTPGTWEYTKGLGREAFLEGNPLVNLGAWAIKKATGQKTEGTLELGTALKEPDPGYVESLKEGVKFMTQHPLQATAELAKGLVYSPELAFLALSKGPQMVEKAAELAKLGRTTRALALTGEQALEGGAAMGGISLVQQAAQKEKINYGEAGAQATIGAALIPALHGIKGAYKGVDAWASKERPGKGAEPTPEPDRFSDYVGKDGEVISPGEEAARQPVPRGPGDDKMTNMEQRAYDLMQRGASKKEVEAALRKNPDLEIAMQAVRERRASAQESFGRGVQQGEWLGPEEPRGPEQVTQEPTGTEMVKYQEQQAKQRRLESGEADPRLLAALGLTAVAGATAVANPEYAKELAGDFALGGALLMTAGKMPDVGALRTLGGELSRGKYTLKTLERLPQNRTEIPKSMIEQELRRADVPKAEKDVLGEVLAKVPGEHVTAQELVRDFRLATGDHTLEAKETGDYADYGLENIRRGESFKAGAPESSTTTLYRLPEHMEVSDANHFNDPRLFGWTRSFDEGGVKHVVEIQSDLAQHAKGAVKAEELPRLQEEYRAASDQHMELRALREAGNEAYMKQNLDRMGLEYDAEKPIGPQVRRLFDEASARQHEILNKMSSTAVGSQVGPMIKHWPRRLIREELAKTAQEGGDVVRFATADTVAKVEGWGTNEVRIERLNQNRADLQKNIASVDRYYPPEQRAQVKADLGKSLAQVEKDIAEFKPGFQDPGHQSIYDRYADETTKYLKSLGGKPVIDASGHSWIEVPTKEHAGRVQQYGKADPKLLAAVGLVSAGVLAGGLLAGDSKVAGAVLGGIVGAGLMRLPRTLAGMGKTLSWKQASWNAARVGAVLGAGTYIGGKTGDPIYGAAAAASIILGKAVLKPAVKLTTDKFISLRNGNIAAQKRLTENLQRDIRAAVPEAERRVAVAEALDKGSVEGLNPKERQVYRYMRDFLDGIGKEALDAEIIKGMRANYVSYIVERDPLMTLEQESSILQNIFEGGQGGSQGSPNSRFGKRGKYETFDEINKALKGSGLRLKTQDIAEIAGIYAKSMRTAIENKILLDSLKATKTTAGMDFLVRQDKNGNLPQGYEKFQHPQMAGYGVHPDLVDSLNVVLNNSDPNVVTRGFLGLAMAVKRVQVFGSAFHAKSLMEVYINAMGKDFYSTKTGINMEPINQALKMYREGGLGDTLDLGIRNSLSMQIPLDVSQTIIGNIGKAIDGITPKLVGKELKIGTAITDKIDFVNGKLDKLTWDYLHAGIKGAIFLKEFETMTLRNAEAHAKNPKTPLKSREQIAKEVATYANDLTGGLDWFQIAADSKTQLGRQLGMYFAGPEGRRFAQMLAFAPDWAVSTLRAGFRAFGESDRTFKGLWKPENTTDLYRRYALRSTLYWITLLNGINMATSGHSVFENKDPTRIEFEDGTSMQAGKHTFEAVHAVMDPVKFAYNKLGYSPKMLFDLFSGKEGYGDKAPKYDNFAIHAAETALPFTASAARQPGLSTGERIKRSALSSGGFPIYGTTAEQKAQVKIERAATRERRRQTRKDWGGAE